MNENFIKQFNDLKAKHPDAVLLFRTRDFYESYNEDAQEVVNTLGVVLTEKEGVKVAAFPYHSLDVYLPKLIRAGKRVAICDQIEQPTNTLKR